jgi:omega-hydroxy-beta-dihydromenaquinone-9 sulfotransferase
LCYIIIEKVYIIHRFHEIRSPVFIIGMFRSATTLCQNIMKSDTHHFSHLKLGDLLFAPSVIQKKFVSQIMRLDKKLNGAIYNMASRIDRLIFQKLENHHPMRLLNMEEDHFMFFNTLTAPALWMLAPGVFKQNTVLKRYDDQNKNITGIIPRLSVCIYAS